MSTKSPTGSLVGYIIHIPNNTTQMTLTELKALAQDLRNERTEFQRKADNAQACLNEIQRKMAIMKLEAQMDTPMADTYGGWAPLPAATIITYQTNTNELRQP